MVQGYKPKREIKCDKTYKLKPKSCLREIIIFAWLLCTNSQSSSLNEIIRANFTMLYFDDNKDTESLYGLSVGGI